MKTSNNNVTIQIKHEEKTQLTELVVNLFNHLPSGSCGTLERVLMHVKATFSKYTIDKQWVLYCYLEAVWESTTKTLSAHMVKALLLEGCNPLALFMVRDYPLFFNLKLEDLEDLLTGITISANPPNQHAFTALHQWSICGYFYQDIAQRLKIALKIGIDVNQRESNFLNTCVHTAIINEYPGEYKRNFFAHTMIEVFQQEDTPYVWDTIDINERSVLLLAACMRATDLVKALLNPGSKRLSLNVNMQDIHGNTALHYAYAYGDRVSLEALLLNKAVETIYNKEGKLPAEMLSTPPDKISQFLKEVSIDKVRNENASCNYILDMNKGRTLYPVQQQACSTLMNSFKCQFVPRGYNKHTPEEQRDFNYFASQVRHPTTRSLLEACVVGQQNLKTSHTSQACPKIERSSSSRVDFFLAEKSSIEPLKKVLNTFFNEYDFSCLFKDINESKPLEVQEYAVIARRICSSKSSECLLKYINHLAIVVNKEQLSRIIFTEKGTLAPKTAYDYAKNNAKLKGILGFLQTKRADSITDEAGGTSPPAPLRTEREPLDSLRSH